jgi:hypothetical protein
MTDILKTFEFFSNVHFSSQQLGGVIEKIEIREDYKLNMKLIQTFP